MTQPKPYEAVLDLDASKELREQIAVIVRAQTRVDYKGRLDPSSPRDIAEAILSLPAFQQHRRVVEALRENLPFCWEGTPHRCAKLGGDTPGSEHKCCRARAALALTSLCEGGEVSPSQSQPVLSSNGHTEAEEPGAREPLFTDDDVRAELAAFYERVNFPEHRRLLMSKAFETGLERDGRWPSVVMHDLGFAAVRAYRRVAPPKDKRDPLPAPPSEAG